MGTAAALPSGWCEAALLRLAEMGIVVPTLIVALVAGARLGPGPTTAGGGGDRPLRAVVARADPAGAGPRFRARGAGA